MGLAFRVSFVFRLSSFVGFFERTEGTHGGPEKLVSGVTLTDQNNIRKSADDVKQVGLKHRRGIDGEFQATDDLVQQICDKYQTRKWFKIDAHGGSGFAGSGCAA